MENIAVVEKIREFNRFYTRQIGLLEKKILKSKYSLPEARILFEIHHKANLSSSDIVKDLKIDPSYLSRIIQKLCSSDLIIKINSSEDSRKQLLSLTENGKEAIKNLQKISNLQISNMINRLSKNDQSNLLDAMDQIKSILSENKSEADIITIRSHQPGDIGYLSFQHSRFYSTVYGFDITFDSYVAGAMVKFIDNFNPEKDRLWIIEKNNRIMGSIAIVKADEGVAQLRWFLLEKELHGKGIGKKLITTAIDFCREKKYQKIILWTFKDLTAARTLYSKYGFKIIETKKHDIWGQNIEEELWELNL